MYQIDFFYRIIIEHYHISTYRVLKIIIFDQMNKVHTFKIGINWKSGTET